MTINEILLIVYLYPQEVLVQPNQELLSKELIKVNYVFCIPDQIFYVILERDPLQVGVMRAWTLIGYRITLVTEN